MVSSFFRPGKGFPRSIVFQRKGFFRMGWLIRSSRLIQSHRIRIGSLIFNRFPLLRSWFLLVKWLAVMPSLANTPARRVVVSSCNSPDAATLLSRPILRKKCLKCRTPDRTLNHFDRKPQGRSSNNFYGRCIERRFLNPMFFVQYPVCQAVTSFSFSGLSWISRCFPFHLACIRSFFWWTNWYHLPGFLAWSNSGSGKSHNNKPSRVWINNLDIAFNIFISRKNQIWKTRQ